MPPAVATLLLLIVAWPLLQLAGWHRQRPVATGFVVVALLTVAALLAGEALRLPLLPALLVLVWWEIRAVNVMVGDIPPAGVSLPRRFRRAFLQMALVIPALLLPAAVLPTARPAPPTGPFPVGTVDLLWTDSSRSLPIGGPRLIPVQVWYPGEPDPGLRIAARHRALAVLESDLAPLLGVGHRPWMVRGLTRSRPGAFRDMRLSTRQREYPVVILSHGFAGTPAIHTGLAMEMASHGLVVIAPEHVGGAIGSVLPGDRYVPLPSGARFGDPGGDRRAWLDQWVADGRAILAEIRELARSDSAGRFTGRLALDRVGWVGQGIGAAAGGRLVTEGSVHAVVELDSGIPEAAPADFTDLARWSPVLLRRAGLGGQVPAARMESELRGAVASFLATRLRR